MKSKLMMMLFMAYSAGLATAAQNVVVLLDDSGSMEEQMRGQKTRRIDAAKDALLTVLNQVPDDGSIGVLALNGTSGDGEWIIDLGPINKTEIADAVGRIRAGGGTPLGAFMKTATDALLELREKEYYGTYRLLVVTDGEANDAPYLDAILPEVLSRNITVDVIGVDMETEHSLATQVDNYRRADDPDSLQQAISASLAEVASSSDEDAGSDSDYELLDGLPDDIASVVIAALVDNQNQPISEPEGYSRAHGRQGQPGYPISTGARPEPSSGSGGIGVALFMMIVFVTILGKLIAASNSKRRRS